jgi:NitT/TauT family transport system substrate-binding protein
MRIGSIVFPGYETLFLARELGLLDAQKVRLVELPANTDALRALAAGQLEAAALTLDELMTARADGVDLRAVLVFDASAGADVVLAKVPITLQSLRGKRIAVEDGAVGAVMLSALLKAAGLAPNQIHKIPMTLDRSEAVFRTPTVDAVVTAEPWAVRLEKAGAHRIFDSQAIPGRIVDVLAVRVDALQTFGPALRHLLTGHFAAQKVLRDAIARAAPLMAARLQTPAAEVAALYRGLQLPELAQNRAMLAPGGTIDQTAKDLQTVMLEAGLLPATAVAQAEAVADSRFLPA